MESNPAVVGYPGSVGSSAALADATRVRAARLLRCGVEELVIMRSATDGINAVAQGMRLASGDPVLISDQEHAGGTACWQYPAKRDGIIIDTIAIPPGENDLQEILDRMGTAITARTRVITISYVLSSTGLRMPIHEIAVLARTNGIVCVIDGAQAVGGINVDVKALGCHASATSGHKLLMGPKGTGLLYITVDADSAIQPIQLESGRAYYSASSGEGNIPGVVGLGVAIGTLAEIGLGAVERHDIMLCHLLHDLLSDLDTGCVVSAAPGSLAAPNLTFEFA